MKRFTINEIHSQECISRIKELINENIDKALKTQLPSFYIGVNYILLYKEPKPAQGYAPAYDAGFEVCNKVVSRQDCEGDCREKTVDAFVELALYHIPHTIKSNENYTDEFYI